MNDIVSTVINTSPYILGMLQALSYIAAIAVVGIGLKGLQQLSVAKDTLKTQSRRDARKISADYVYRYLDRVVSAEWDLTNSEEYNELLEHFRFSAEADDDYINIEEILKNAPSTKLSNIEQREKYANKLEKAGDPYRYLLNELEAFCSIVTSGVLDEVTLSRAVGRHFIFTIESNNLEQLIHYWSEKDHIYTNVAEIYDLWKLRVTLQELEKVESYTQKTAAEIESIKQRLGKIEKQTITPIGAEYDL